MMKDALVHMIDWIGDREYKIYAWSESDRAQLLHEIKAKKINDIRIRRQSAMMQKEISAAETEVDEMNGDVKFIVKTEGILAE